MDDQATDRVLAPAAVRHWRRRSLLAHRATCGILRHSHVTMISCHIPCSEQRTGKTEKCRSEENGRMFQRFLHHRVGILSALFLVVVVAPLYCEGQTA